MGEAANKFLEESGGGEGHDPVKFKEIGDKVVGKIMDEPRPVERKSLNDGTPEMQLPINLDTADGPRTLWVRKGFLAGAIQDAVKEAGATGIEVGGSLGVELTEKRDTGKPQPANVFKAAYKKPEKEATSIESIFG